MNLVVKRITVALFVLALAVFTAVSASRTSVVAAADEGADLYKTKCVACHGADGSGSAVGLKMGARDLRSAEVQKMTDAQLAGIISKGKNKMPSYEKTLAAGKINVLVAHIRALGKKH